MLMIKQELGALIRDLRLRKDLTQEALSQKSGIGNRYLQDIEAGNKQPSITTLFKLADALQVKPSKLIESVHKSWIEAGKPS